MPYFNLLYMAMHLNRTRVARPHLNSFSRPGVRYILSLLVHSFETFEIPTQSLGCHLGAAYSLRISHDDGKTSYPMKPRNDLP